MFRIQLKKSTNPDAMNAILKALGSVYTFVSQKTNQAWADNINTDPELAHLKPEGGMTIELLKKTFSAWTKDRELTADADFSRMSNRQANLLAKFIFENQDQIKFVKNGDDLINKGGITTKKHIRAIDELNKKPLPRLRRPEEDRREAPTSGIMLAKTWGIKQCWIMFGNVEKDKPVFMKDDEFASNNGLYRDKEGRGFFLMPLYDFSPNFAQIVTEAAWEMSIREHPNYLLGGLYDNIFEIEKDGIEELANAFGEFYTKDEIVERLDAQLRKAIGSHGIGGVRGLSFNGTKNIHKFTSNSGQVQKTCNFLNTLILAVSLYDKNIAYENTMAMINEFTTKA
jgi:hypothetical protein